MLRVCVMSATEKTRAAQRFTGGVAVEIHCRRCGRAFVPSPDANGAGPETNRDCEQCRPAGIAGEKPEVPA